MSQTRDALEMAQRALSHLDASAVMPGELEHLARQLEGEIDTWEVLLDRGEKRVLARERPTLASSVMTFGFAVVFMGPVVAIVGTALSRMMRHQTELNVLSLCIGLVVVGVVSWGRARRALSHRVSREWRMLRTARAQVAALYALSRGPE